MKRKYEMSRQLLRDSDELQTAEYVSLLIQYLATLQDGRAKPDRDGGGYIRESSYNIDEIAEVKRKLNDIFKTTPRVERVNTVIFDNKELK